MWTSASQSCLLPPMVHSMGIQADLTQVMLFPLSNEKREHWIVLTYYERTSDPTAAVYHQLRWRGRSIRRNLRHCTNGKWFWLYETHAAMN